MRKNDRRAATTAAERVIVEAVVDREAARPPSADGPSAVDRKAAVRLRAYLDWEAAGRPAGDGVDFWLRAERELSNRR